MSGYPPSQAPGYPPVQNPAYPPNQPYPPPPQYQPPVQQLPTQTVVVAQPVVTVTAPLFKNYPVTVTDSNGQQVQTVLEYRAGLMTYLVAGVLCLLLTELGLCWLGIIPFFIRDFKDIYHITPTDGKVVGIYKRL